MHIRGTNNQNIISTAPNVSCPMYILRVLLLMILTFQQKVNLAPVYVLDSACLLLFSLSDMCFKASRQAASARRLALEKVAYLEWQPLKQACEAAASVPELCASMS
jgi:hypothetical protein